MSEDLPALGEEAFDADAQRPVWWDGIGWSYVPPLVPRPRSGDIPLSFSQQRLWFVHQLHGDSREYHIPEAWRLRGVLDVVALERTFATIVARHEVLRTCFVEIDGSPVQRIQAEMSVSIARDDFSDLSGAVQAAAVRGAMEQEWEQPFDLCHGPLLRLRLLRLGPTEHVLLRTCHHIISDGWSMGVFNREFASLYGAYCRGGDNPLEPLPLHYGDYTLWQSQWLQGEALEQGRAYWREQLTGIPPLLELPTDHARPPVLTHAAGLHLLTLSGDQLSALRRFSQRHRVTEFMVLLAVFGVLMQRYSGQTDMVVGTPIANRQDAQLERLIGFFVNMLALRLRPQADMRFSDFLATVRQTTLDAYRYQDIPFERLVEDLAPRRSLNTSPIFQVQFALQNAPMGTALLEGLEIVPEQMLDLRARFDLEVHGFERDGALTFWWIYSGDLFDAARVEQMAAHYLTLLESALSAPEREVRWLDALSISERSALLPPVPVLTATETLVTRFERQVAARADAKAVSVSRAEYLSYAGLNARANRLAHRLMAQGVGPEARVGVRLGRSLDLVVALLAVLKAGAAYVPLDPDYPAARLDHMIRDAGITVVVDAHSFGHLDGMSPENPAPRAGADNAAYVIYTSGSTGLPKGCVVTHAQRHPPLFTATDPWYRVRAR